MKITPKILHIPPYLSTTWLQVRAVYLRENDLIVSLLDGVTITIPGLSPEIRNVVFEAYAAFQESQQTRIQLPAGQEKPPLLQIFQVPQDAAGPFTEGNPQFSIESMESIASALQHNLSQANMPNLPEEVLNKIAAVAKIISAEDIENMPKPEPHCNCPHCQIARAIHGMRPETTLIHPENNAQIPASEMASEEEITEQDLSFQQWEIAQTGERLFSVTNRLDSKERYSVYLGHPVGCTCGKPGCEHILAVLKS